MATKKKPSAAQLAARKKFVEMVRAKAKAKKSTTKKAKPSVKKSSTHKDTKSHNVNVKVVSGINRDVLGEITRLIKWNDELEKTIIAQKTRLKTDKSGIVKASIMRYQDLLKSNKKHLTQLKKQIK